MARTIPVHKGEVLCKSPWLSTLYGKPDDFSDLAIFTEMPFGIPTI